MQFLAVILIKIDHDEEQDQISYRFIELSRMAGEHVYPFEYERPGYIGRVTDNFGVHQIRQTDETGSDRSSDGNHVHHIHIMKFRLATIQPKGDHQSERTSVTGKSFITGEFPSAACQELDRQKHFHKSLSAGQVLSRIVEQAVPQTCSNQNTEETIKEEGIEFLLVYFFVAKLVMDNDVSKEDSYCPQ